MSKGIFTYIINDGLKPEDSDRENFHTAINFLISEQLTPYEYWVYCHLKMSSHDGQTGKSTAREIAKKSNMSRTQVYKCLESLQLKGILELRRTIKTPRPTQKTKGIIYIVRAGDAYKIGMTTKPMKYRLRSIQANCPLKVELIHTIPSDDAFTLEGYLHSHFKSQRIRYEWFSLTGDDIDFIKSTGGNQ